jgi:hypothetical protein
MDVSSGARLDVLLSVTRSIMNERKLKMADPTKIVDVTAPIYATEMHEVWDEITDERKMQWRALAYKVYEAHVKNKLEGLDMAAEIVEAVQVAPSTPKSWLRGVQEAKNALVWATDKMKRDIETRVTVPETLPEDFNAEDPYKDLRAGDMVPTIVPRSLQCGAENEDAWVCTRERHPAHWHHWDDDLGLADDEQEEELMEAIEGRILVTWFDGESVDSLHPALGDLEED